MGHPIHKVKAFEIEGPYRLRIEFDDGLVRTIDFRPVLEGELYGPLRDVNQFNAVSLDREVHAGLAKRGRFRSRHPARLAPSTKQT